MRDFDRFFILRHLTKTEVGFKDGSIIVIIDNHYQLWVDFWSQCQGIVCV